MAKKWDMAMKINFMNFCYMKKFSNPVAKFFTICYTLSNFSNPFIFLYCTTYLLSFWSFFAISEIGLLLLLFKKNMNWSWRFNLVAEKCALGMCRALNWTPITRWKESGFANRHSRIQFPTDPLTSLLSL